MKRLQRFKDDDDPISIFPMETRKVPKSLEDMVRSTKFTKSEIRLLYKSFKQECPSGAVTEREFHSIYSHFFPHGNCQNYTRFLFRILDRRKRTYFTFEDYVQTLSVLVRGNVKEKVEWIFHFYDITNDGRLTKQSLGKLLRSFYELLGPNVCLHYPVNGDTIEEHSEILFEKMDSQRSGSVNLDDFERYCFHDEELMHTIDLLSSTVI